MKLTIITHDGRTIAAQEFALVIIVENSLARTFVSVSSVKFAACNIRTNDEEWFVVVWNGVSFSSRP